MSMTLTPTLISIFIIWVQLALRLRLRSSHYMSMATPTLISTFFIWVRQVCTHVYDTNAYAHLYFYNMGTASSETTATLITLYEYGYAYAHLYYFYMGTASLRSSVSMTLTPTLISIFIIWVQLGLWLLSSHYMSMATPTLISTIFFNLNAANTGHPRPHST